MKYRQQYKVSLKTLKLFNDKKEEIVKNIIRDCVIKLIDSLSSEDFNKLFNVEYLEPFTYEFNEKYEKAQIENDVATLDLLRRLISEENTQININFNI